MLIAPDEHADTVPHTTSACRPAGTPPTCPFRIVVSGFEVDPRMNSWAAVGNVLRTNEDRSCAVCRSMWTEGLSARGTIASEWSITPAPGTRRGRDSVGVRGRRGTLSGSVDMVGDLCYTDFVNRFHSHVGCVLVDVCPARYSYRFSDDFRILSLVLMPASRHDSDAPC